MATADVVVKCEEYMDNEIHIEDATNAYFNMYEQLDRPEQENNENHCRNTADEDLKMQELLREFDLEILYTILKLSDITYRSLKYISENDINAAIRSIAYRAEFREKLFAWRRDKYGLNDFSVLPVQPKKTTMPLGTNNNANIMVTIPTAAISNSKTYNSNDKPETLSTTSTASATVDVAPAVMKTMERKKSPTRRPSAIKTYATKKIRLSNDQMSNTVYQNQAQTETYIVASTPPSPSGSNYSMTSSTPNDKIMSILPHPENTSEHLPPVMQYDNSLCFQPTTSSAAAAAASTPIPTPVDLLRVQEPPMSIEKLCYLETAKKRTRGCSEYIWSKEKIDRLIELYEPRQELWDPASELYRDHGHKQRIFSEMSAELGISVQDLSAKIHNLRCQYNAVLRKIRRLKKDAGPNEILQQPRWEYFNALKFLSTAKRYSSNTKLSTDLSPEELRRNSAPKTYANKKIRLSSNQMPNADSQNQVRTETFTVASSPPSPTKSNYSMPVEHVRVQQPRMSVGRLNFDDDPNVSTDFIISYV